MNRRASQPSTVEVGVELANNIQLLTLVCRYPFKIQRRFRKCDQLGGRTYCIDDNVANLEARRLTVRLLHGAFELLGFDGSPLTEVEQQTKESDASVAGHPISGQP